MEPKITTTTNNNNIESGVIRTCLLYEYKLGSKAAEAARKICLAFGENAISKRTAQQWFKKFNESGGSIRDAPRSGRPKKHLNIDDVRMAVSNNPKISCQELSQMFNVSGETIRLRMHELNIYWRQGKWIQLMKKKNAKQKKHQLKSPPSPEASHEPCEDVNSPPTTAFDHHHPHHQQQQRRISSHHSNIRIDDKTAADMVAEDDDNQQQQQQQNNNVRLLAAAAAPSSPTESVVIQSSIVVPLEISYHHSGPDLRLIQTTIANNNHHHLNPMTTSVHHATTMLN